jgi:NADPH:quinone reductase
VRAIRIHQHGGPEVLTIDDVDDPTPGPGELLVEVAAAGVNYIDTYHREGLYPQTLPMVPGLEGAGTVRSVGEGVDTVKVGDRVAWADVAGSYAELAAVSADRTVVVPPDVDAETAAALLLQGMTAHYLSSSTYKLGSDDVALVYAAAGGVGRLLVQLAKRRDARVLACTSTPAKADQVRELGADEVILYRDVDLPEVVADLTDGEGVDVVYDSVGADTFETSLDCLKPRGLMVLYGQSSGPVPPVDLQILARKGSLYVTRPTLFSYVPTHDELEWRAGSLFELVRSGQLDVLVHDRYPLDEAARAHTDLQSGATAGKLLLIP